VVVVATGGSRTAPTTELASGLAMTAQRDTRQKRALAAVLDASEGFRSAQDLHADLLARGERVSLTTVYNQLRALADAGEVDTRRTGDGETVYRRCGTDHHHHHLVCRDCGTTVEVEGPAVERWADRVAAAHGFVDMDHTVELVGTCARCAGA
jgi:Fur family ferric uptake transcriptional regulator